MTRTILLATAALALNFPALAQEEPQGAPSPGEIVASASASDWMRIPAEDLLVMTLAPAADGSDRTVVIQLMPAPFSQGWVHNIRLFARAGWYDGISVNRVQDNYVTQWGDPNYDNPEATGKPKPLPEGLKVMGEAAYSQSMEAMATVVEDDKVNLERDESGRYLPLHEEKERRAMISIASTRTSTAPQGWHQRDSYGYFVEFYKGWPIASNNVEDLAVFYPTHCYGMVGVGRNYSPDTGSGAELYTVIGHAPRHLDRNIALVGRVIEGMEHLSSLPRGKGDLGFYAADEMEKRTPILTVRVASDLATSEQPAFEYLSTESESFARYADARANRRDPFFIVPAGGADICNIPLPVRRVAE